MSKGIPPVHKYMTASPITIGHDQKIMKAEEIMRENRIRHLPVLKGGKFVGILSDRDVKFVETLRDLDIHKLIVDDVAREQAFTVEADSPLDQVAAEMAENKYGSAIVTQNGKLVGIFTTVDAMRALSELLRTRLGH